MATAPIDLCHKLIALATNNPNEEEAKLAALKAVRLIKEHNLLPGAPPVARDPFGDIFDKDLQDYINRERQDRQSQYTYRKHHPMWDNPYNPPDLFDRTGMTCHGHTQP